MKYQSLLFSILFSVGVLESLPAQVLPHLERYYPLENREAKEKIGGWNGTIRGQVYNFTDRLGNPNGAMQFADNASISIPSMLYNFDYKNTGFAISFWVYVDENLSKQTGLVPWRDTDPVVQAFYVKQDQATLFGFHRRGDRAVIDRSTRNTSGQLKSWNLWLWDPLNFTNRTGWYQVFLSCEKGRAFIYSFYPSGELACSSHYFGMQDLPDNADWGIGNNSGKSFIMDDLRVYRAPLSEQQARVLHAQGGILSGMYRILLADDQSQQVHTIAHQTSQSTQLEILPQTRDFHVYKWIIMPVSGKPNVYTIRLAYEDLYIHLPNNTATSSCPIEILGYDPAKADSYEWYIEVDSFNGTYLIRSNANRSFYLHTKGNAITSSTRLELLGYDPAHGGSYAWMLEPLKSNYDILQNPIPFNSNQDLILSDNTFLGLSIVTPITSDAAPLRTDRGTYPSLLYNWKFYESMDGAYRLGNSSQTSYFIHPVSYSITPGNGLEGYGYFPSYNKFYSFVLEKPNKYGRRFYIKPVVDQSLCVVANSNTSKSSITLQDQNDPRSNQWALYQSGTPNSAKQVYNIKPGIYRIVSGLDSKKSIAPQNYGWTTSTRLVLKTTSGTRYTSHYWVVDYERDVTGNPVLDGTYTIQLFATDKLYFHTTAHSLSDSAPLEIYPLDRDNIQTQKWFIKQSATPGSYYIQPAGDPSKYVHLSAYSTAENTPIELWHHVDGYESTYLWNFESVSVVAPFGVSTQKVVSQQNQSQYLHVQAHSVSDGQLMEVYYYEPSYDNSYKWQFLKADDNTYYIQNMGSLLFVHLKGHSSAAATLLEQYHYESGYAPYYKWIVMPGTRVAGTYTIVSVADPTQYIHLKSHSATPSNLVEVYPYDSSHADAYEWRLQ